MRPIQLHMILYKVIIYNIAPQFNMIKNLPKLKRNQNIE